MALLVPLATTTCARVIFTAQIYSILVNMKRP